MRGAEKTGKGDGPVRSAARPNPSRSIRRRCNTFSARMNYAIIMATSECRGGYNQIVLQEFYIPDKMIHRLMTPGSSLACLFVNLDKAQEDKSLRQLFSPYF